MSSAIQISKRGRLRSRLNGRAPRAIAFAFVGLFALAGVRAAIAGPREASAPVAPQAETNLAVESFAEAFVRVYLTWNAARPEAHEQDVARYVSSSLEAGAGLSPPSSGSEDVAWTSVAADKRVGAQRVVTVAAQTTRRTVYLAVPIQTEPNGLLVVSNYPALVGPPATDPAFAPTDEAETEDGGLRAVAERAVRNYLSREKANLLADLAPNAVVGLPTERLVLQSVDSISSAGTGRVSVAAEAKTRDGAVLHLRYVLAVVKTDRWYVRSIQGDVTTAKEGQR